MVGIRLVLLFMLGRPRRALLRAQSEPDAGGPWTASQDEDTQWLEDILGPSGTLVHEVMVGIGRVSQSNKVDIIASSSFQRAACKSGRKDAAAWIRRKAGARDLTVFSIGALQYQLVLAKEEFFSF